METILQLPIKERLIHVISVELAIDLINVVKGFTSSTK